MNLKNVYEIFYPGKVNTAPCVWKEPPKYRSKKEFFEEVIPMEIRWLNIKLWNDKARRSRFLSDCNSERKYLKELKREILQNPFFISRIERKCKILLKDHIETEIFEKTFLEIVTCEQIAFSPSLEKYLKGDREKKGRKVSERIFTFLFLYALFPEEINQIYAPYLFQKENGILVSKRERQDAKDDSLFLSEYPPDMSIHRPGEILCHTWMIRNAGEVIWEERYLECDPVAFEIGEENKRIPLPETVYPGDTVTISVRFPVPESPGSYMINWKARRKDGTLAFPGRLGLGLHFTVMQADTERDWEETENNYKVLEESPAIPQTLIAGEGYSHTWLLQNTGSMVWKDYCCECMNGEAFRYAKSELQIPIKKIVKPGECVYVKIEFVTPPVEGVYRLVWRIMKKDGTSAFAEGRQLEILLNLV